VEELLYSVVDGGKSKDRAGMVGERDVVGVDARDRLTSEDRIALAEDLVQACISAVIVGSAMTCSFKRGG
jgi:hypothetical protein